jgi:hypothetical protein
MILVPRNILVYLKAYKVIKTKSRNAIHIIIFQTVHNIQLIIKHGILEPPATAD